MDYFYFDLEKFKFICCCWNKEFYLYMLPENEMKCPQAELLRICEGAEITICRTECFNEQGVGVGFRTGIDKVILPHPNSALEEIKAKIKKNYNFVHSEEYVPDNEACKAILEKNEITCLYHFTDRRNIESIVHCGGLYSWFYCEMTDIEIPFGGGDAVSRVNDLRHGLHDYVRLSFCRSHPMCGRLETEGRDLVLLHIDPQVALWRDTQFSDINAADNDHCHGAGAEMLGRIRFDATKREFVHASDLDFKYRQAEVLVKTHIPLKYILNIDEIASGIVSAAKVEMV